MRTIKLTALIAATLAFDAIIVWLLAFTVFWEGTIPPIDAIGFWMVVATPFVVTAYCIVKLTAFRDDGEPRI